MAKDYLLSTGIIGISTYCWRHLSKVEIKQNKIVENYIKLPELTPTNINELINDSPKCSQRLK